MDVFNPFDRLPESHRGGAVAIGNFDGVHAGHLQLVQTAKTLATAPDCLGPAGVLSFEPHPRSLFRPGDPAFRLTSLATKTAALKRAGASFAAVAAFDRAFADLSAEAFIDKVLVEGLGAQHVVVGADFRFGRQRAGDIPALEQAGRDKGFSVTALDQIGDDEGVYSSSRIRQHIQTGDIRSATVLLGRPWEIASVVEQGDQRGRTIGFPTANLRLGDLIEPVKGVYAVRVRVGAADGVGISKSYDGVANFGRRPTVNDRGSLLEVHLFDASLDLYGQTLWVSFVDFLRGERKFDGLDELKAQIGADCDRARAILDQLS